MFVATFIYTVQGMNIIKSLHKQQKFSFEKQSVSSYKKPTNINKHEISQSRCMNKNKKKLFGKLFDNGSENAHE